MITLLPQNDIGASRSRGPCGHFRQDVTRLGIADVSSDSTSLTPDPSSGRSRFVMKPARGGPERHRRPPPSSWCSRRRSSTRLLLSRRGVCGAVASRRRMISIARLKLLSLRAVYGRPTAVPRQPDKAGYPSPDRVPDGSRLRGRVPNNDRVRNSVGNRALGGGLHDDGTVNVERFRSEDIQEADLDSLIAERRANRYD